MKVSKSTFFVIVITIFMIIAYLFLFNTTFTNQETVIWVLSIIGIIEMLFVLYTSKNKFGTYFSLYSIFALFAFAFCYGQCFMWAFGIHIDSEIGSRVIFSNRIGIASKTDIIKTQLLTLVGLMVFHCGAMIQDKGRLASEMPLSKNIDSSRAALFTVSKIFAVFSFPATLINAIRLLVISRTYGYGANLYNADVISSQSNIIILLSMSFFASIVGLLIGSNYKKSVVVLCYTVFGLYALLCTLGGDRGEWLYPLLFLIWLNASVKKNLNKRKMFKYFLLGFILLVVLAAVKNVRNYGVTVEALIEAIKTDNPISSTLFEMGRQMIIPLIFIQGGWNIYPYGNSYLLAFAGMISERFITLFINPHYTGISGWLSQSYLGITYGAGFSMIAEALANYGPYFCLIALFVIGIIYSKVMDTRYMDCENSPIGLFFKITTARALIISIRNPLLTSLKNWFFSTVIILIAVYLFMSIRDSKKT